MTANQFRGILEAAIAGQQDALEEIFRIYRPLLEKMSSVDGKLDEDLLQKIQIRIALNISKYHI